MANPGLQQSRGCFGCAQPTPIIAVDEPTKGLRIQGRSVKRRNLSDDFWSSSPHELENSALQSRHSMSSISTAAQSNDQHASGSSSSPNEFVNQGKLVTISTSPEQMVLMFGALIYNDCLFHTPHEFETNICLLEFCSCLFKLHFGMVCLCSRKFSKMAILQDAM